MIGYIDCQSLDILTPCGEISTVGSKDCIQGLLAGKIPQIFANGTNDGIFVADLTLTGRSGSQDKRIYRSSVGG
jgi:hypothetical protein